MGDLQGKPMYIGSGACYDIRVGNNLVYSAYFGTELVYLRAGSEPSFKDMYLTFEVLSAGTINWQYEETQGWNPRSIEYKLNNGNWTSITATTAGTEINVSAGDNISFRGGEQFYRYSTFSGSTAYFNAYGNIMSLIDPNNFANLTTLTGGLYTHQYAFEGLLQGTNVVSAKELVLPATALTQYCYQRMFQYCTSLTDTPELPATDLDSYCYGAMFMGCDKITTTPALPATTLADFCYEWMFQGCTGLTSSPTLSASTIENGSYMGMFRNCSNINYIECYATSFVSAATSLWVDGVASAGTFVRDSASTWSVGIDGIPTGWDVVPPLPVPPVDYKTLPLTFEILSAGTLVFTSNDSNINKQFQYRVNDGEWATGRFSKYAGNTINVNAGDKVELKGDNDTYARNTTGASITSASTSIFNIYGNMMSMVNSSGYTEASALTNFYTFCRMFAGSNVVDASNLVLPAMKLTGYCYQEMFMNCTSLTSAPQLPAEQMKTQCYYKMFQGCTSLTAVTSALPITYVEGNCCESMFEGCTSLTTAPELPMATLSNGCYKKMFSGCTNLQYIKCLATTLNFNNTTNWVADVAASGTFVKASGMSSWETGANGIPTGWSVQDAS